jgi:hypothetical protein
MRDEQDPRVLIRMSAIISERHDFVSIKHHKRSTTIYYEDLVVCVVGPERTSWHKDMYYHRDDPSRPAIIDYSPDGTICRLTYCYEGRYIRTNNVGANQL